MDTPEITECDLRLERAASPVLHETTGHCGSMEDSPSRQGLGDILADEEQHID
ncbi:MAG: hypothetical protein P8076_04940 [Gammaproteobacteria bacterium]